MSENTYPSKGIKSKHHPHPLIMANKEEKKYIGSWLCDLCRLGNKREPYNFVCITCKWDICESCLFKEIDEEVKNLKTRKK